MRVRLIGGALALPLALVAACSGPAQQPTPEASAAPVKVAGSVVSTATSANEAAIVIPEPVTASWTNLAQKGSGVEWVKVAGDAGTSSTPADLATEPQQAIGRLTEELNANNAQADGRSALAGLNALSSPAASPVWVFSPLLDTTGPLDFTELAFDTSPTTVVKATKKAGRSAEAEGPRRHLRGDAAGRGSRRSCPSSRSAISGPSGRGSPRRQGRSGSRSSKAPEPHPVRAPSPPSRYPIRTTRSIPRARVRPGPAPCPPRPSSWPISRR